MLRVLSSLALGSWGGNAAGMSSASQTSANEASLPTVTEAVTSMEQALKDVALLVEAARSDRKPNVISCLIQKMAQIGKHLRFAKKVEVGQFDAAVRLKDPGAPDIARAMAKRLSMVLELRGQASACAGDYAGYLTGDTALEYEAVPAPEAPTTQFVYGTVNVDSRPPAASPFQ